jgi:hypothetical protein
MGKKPKPTCDICGLAPATAITRDNLRPTVAPWIVKLCHRCEDRFGNRPWRRMTTPGPGGVGA